MEKNIEDVKKRNDKKIRNNFFKYIDIETKTIEELNDKKRKDNEEKINDEFYKEFLKSLKVTEL